MIKENSIRGVRSDEKLMKKGRAADSEAYDVAVVGHARRSPRPREPQQIRMFECSLPAIETAKQRERKTSERARVKDVRS